MLEHGQAVHEQYQQLVAALCAGNAPHAVLNQLYGQHSSAIAPATQLRAYHLYHDCGKPLCLTVTADGKRQFPDHARVSSEQYLAVFPEDQSTARLILRDMDFHTARGAELLELCADPDAITLYLTAWAEVAANAAIFGGTTSESYKIKRSRLISAGKKLLAALAQGARFPVDCLESAALTPRILFPTPEGVLT